MPSEPSMEEPDPTTLPFVWDPEPEPEPEAAHAHGPNRRTVMWASVTALAVFGAFGCAYELGLFSGGGGAPVPAADVSVRTAANPTAWPTHAPYTTISMPASPSATASHKASATPTSPSPTPTTSSPTPSSAAPAAVVAVAPTVLAQTISLPTSQAQPEAPMPVTTPVEQSGESATKVSGSIQCQSMGVEGVYIEAANGGSGWAPWVSSAARPSYATYSYTLSKGGEYSVWVGCGGTPSRWTIATYSTFYSGTVNNFYCYDESDAALWTYCKKA